MVGFALCSVESRTVDRQPRKFAGSGPPEPTNERSMVMSASAVLTERSATGAHHAGAPAHQWNWQFGGAPAAGAAPWLVVPRCELKFAKCEGGFSITCRCDDEVSAATLHNLCKMLAGGGCSCACTYNGIPVCQCNFAMWTYPLRVYEERGEDHLHQRRRQVLPGPPGLLRMLQVVLRLRLLLHRQLRQHPGLLQHLLKQIAVCDFEKSADRNAD